MLHLRQMRGKVIGPKYSVHLNEACPQEKLFYQALKSLCHIPETNVMSYVNYISIFKKRKKDTNTSIKIPKKRKYEYSSQSYIREGN